MYIGFQSPGLIISIGISLEKNPVGQLLLHAIALKMRTVFLTHSL